MNGVSRIPSSTSDNFDSQCNVFLIATGVKVFCRCRSLGREQPFKDVITNDFFFVLNGVIPWVTISPWVPPEKWIASDFKVGFGIASYSLHGSFWI